MYYIIVKLLSLVCKVTYCIRTLNKFGYNIFWINLSVRIDNSALTKRFKSNWVRASVKNTIKYNKQGSFYYVSLQLVFYLLNFYNHHIFYLWTNFELIYISFTKKVIFFSTSIVMCPKFWIFQSQPQPFCELSTTGNC